MNEDMRVLFLSHRLPYTPDRGDRVRAYHLLRQLRQSAELHLVSLVHSDEEASHVPDLTDLVHTVAVARVPWLTTRVRAAFTLPTRRPLTHVLLDSPAMPGILHEIVRTSPPDVVLAYCSGMARFAVQPPLDRYPFVLDMVDVDSAKWRELGAVTRGPKAFIYRREAYCLARFEALATARAAATTVVNQRECDALASLAPGAEVLTVRNGVDLTHLSPPGGPAASAEVVFCGVMDYPPNQEGVSWMVHEVWPRVRAAIPNAHFTIVGSNPGPATRAVASAASGVTVTGRVPDVRPYLWRAALSVAPLLHARGVQNKVLEALAAGLPCVITPAVAAGLPPQALPGCITAADPGAFAANIVARLSMSPADRRAWAARADLSSLSWEECLAPFRSLLETASTRRLRRERA